jgi:serine/threonine protein kinase
MSANSNIGNPKNAPALSDDEYNRKWDQESQLQFIRKASDPRFGEIHVFKRKGTNELVFSKEKMTSSKVAAGNDIRELKSRLALNRPNLQRLLGYSTSERKELCSTSYYTQGFYEFPKTDLAKESSLRVSNGQSFSEGELANVASQALNGLSSLHSQRITHGDIRPQYLGINKDTNEVSILDRLADPSPIEKTQGSHIVGGKNTLYMSPELYKKLQGKDKLIKYDPFKNDVYSLALSVLETGNGRSIKDIYNTNGTVDQAKLDAHLNSFSSKYQGEYLNNFVRSSLKQDESARPTTEELSSRLGSWNNSRVWAQGPQVVTSTETTAYDQNKTQFSSTQVSDPSQAFTTTTTTTQVINQPAVVTNEVVTNQSAQSFTTPAFLKQTNVQSNYVDNDNQNNTYGSQKGVSSFGFSNPTDYATLQEYHSYSQKPNVNTSQSNVFYSATPQVTTTYTQPQPTYTTTYSQAPVSTEYLTSQPVTTNYVSSQPSYTSYTQAPVATTYVSSQPQYTTSYSTPVTTEYITTQPSTKYLTTEPKYLTSYANAPVTTTYGSSTIIDPVTYTTTQPTYTTTYNRDPIKIENLGTQPVTTTTYVSSQPSEYTTTNQVQYQTTEPARTTTYVSQAPSRIETGKSVIFTNAITPATNIGTVSTQYIPTPVTQTVTYNGGSTWIPSSERIVSKTESTAIQVSDANRGSYKTIPSGRRSVSFINYNQTPATQSIKTDNLVYLNRPSYTSSVITEQRSQTIGQPVTISWEEYQRIIKSEGSAKVTPITTYTNYEEKKESTPLSSNPPITISYSTPQQESQVYSQRIVYDQPTTTTQYREVTQYATGSQPQESYTRTQDEEIRQVAEQFKQEQPTYRTIYEGDSSLKNVVSEKYLNQSADIKVKRYRIENGNRVEVSDFSGSK